MNRMLRGRSKKAGLEPGAVVHLGAQKRDHARLTACLYAADSFEENVDADLKDVAALKSKPGVLWVNVDGLHDVDLLQRLGELFGIHLLAQEDVANTHQRPKCEEYDGYLFLVLKIFSSRARSGAIETEHACLVLGPNFVLSFQEGTEDDFIPIRARLREGKGRLRKLGADYLTYVLIDAVVDRIFVILESWSERLDKLEQDTLRNAAPSTLTDLHAIKSDMLTMKKAAWPLREALAVLQRDDSGLFKEATQPYLRDVHDHVVEVIETLETLRENAKGIMDTYMTTMSYRMNEIMKALTLMAAIFIPLTFIVGVYGMNFDVMPELRWRYGYAAVWGVMILVGSGLAWYFGRQKWF